MSNLIDKNMIIIINIIVVILLGCNNNNFDCIENEVVISKFVESEPYAKYWFDLFNKSENFEKSINSTILFRWDTSNIAYGAFKDSILNDKRILKNDSFSCVNCFLEDKVTHLLALRPQTHPFIKEVVVYGGTWNGKYYTYYYYKNETLDALIPDSILAKYDAPFNIDEFMCFRKNLIKSLNTYWRVGEPTYSNCNDKARNPKREFMKINDYYLADEIHWVNDNQNYNWLKKNKDYLGRYTWASYECSGYTDILEVYMPKRIEYIDSDTIPNLYYAKMNEIYILYETSHLPENLKKWGLIK